MKVKRTPVFMSLLLVVLLLPVILIGNQSLDGSAQKKFAKWEWQEATLNAVFDHISKVSGVDIVLDPEITGKISVSLRDKSWKEVFEVICKMKGLYYEVENKYIYVMTETGYIAKQLQKAQGVKNLESLESLEKIMLKLKNTTAKDMQTPVQGLLSERGKVTVVEHTNSLIIDELPKNLERIRSMIDSLDREMLQISISTKIVEVGSGKQNDIGIQWSFFNQASGAQVSHLPSAVKGGSAISKSLEKATFGILDKRGFSVALDYLFTQNNSEVVAEPQITTVENKEAKIFMGSRIPVSSLDYAGNTKITMIDAGTELIVTPRITGDGRVKMELKPTKKSYEMTDQGPIINEQGAETEVVIQDGETVVIAGLTSDDNQHSEGGIPFLKDIPILGYLFKYDLKKNVKKDLVIFVTPHIVKTTALNIMMEAQKKEITSTTTN